MNNQFLKNKIFQFIVITLLVLVVSIWISVKMIPSNKVNTTTETETAENPVKITDLPKVDTPKVDTPEVHTPEEFGANGFDKLLDTAALQEAIDQSDTLILRSGATYIIDRPLVSGHTIKIKSDKKTDKVPVILQINKQSAFIFTNKPTASTQVTKPITKNAAYVTLKSTKGMKPGDLLHLKSNKLWYWDNRDYLTKGELHKILKIDGDKVYLERTTSEDYMIGNGEAVTAKVYPDVSLELSDISFSHPKPYETTMIKVNFTSNAKIKNVSVRNSKNTGIYLNSTYQTEVNHTYINLGTTKNIRTGYGIQDYGGNGTFITDSVFKRVRRGVDFSGVTPSRNGTVINSKAYGSKQETLASGNSGFGTHSTAENITFENNYVQNFTYAFLSRGNNIIVKGNTLEGFSKGFIGISYGGHVEVLNNTYKRLNNSVLSSFIMLTDTYNGSLIATGNTVNGQKGHFVHGDLGSLTQSVIERNTINVK